MDEIFANDLGVKSYHVKRFINEIKPFRDIVQKEWNRYNIGGHVIVDKKGVI